MSGAAQTRIIRGSLMFFTQRKLANASLWLWSMGLLAYSLLNFAQSGDFAGRIQEVVAILCLVVNVLALFARDANMRNTKSVGLFAVIIVLSGVLPILQPTQYPGNAGRWVITHLVVASFVLVYKAYSSQELLKPLLVLVMGSLLPLLWGAGYSVDERSLLTVGRLTGVFGHPNVTGIAAVLLIILASTKLKPSKSAMFAGASVLALSVSLTAFIALGLAVLVYFAGRLAGRVSALVLVVASAVPIYLVFGGNLGLDYSLFTGRVSIWVWLSQVQINPLQGNGIGFFQAFLDERAINWFHAHNQFVMDFATQGMPGLFLTAALIASIFWATWNSPNVSAFTLLAILLIEMTTEIPLYLDSPFRSSFAIFWFIAWRSSLVPAVNEPLEIADPITANRPLNR